MFEDKVETMVKAVPIDWANAEVPPTGKNHDGS
jgi:hypothetical protein